MRFRGLTIVAEHSGSYNEDPSSFMPVINLLISSSSDRVTQIPDNDITLFHILEPLFEFCGITWSVESVDDDDDDDVSQRTMLPIFHRIDGNDQKNVADYMASSSVVHDSVNQADGRERFPLVMNKGRVSGDSTRVNCCVGTYQTHCMRQLRFSADKETTRCEPNE